MVTSNVGQPTNSRQLLSLAATDALSPRLHDAAMRPHSSSVANLQEGRHNVQCLLAGLVPQDRVVRPS